MRYVVIDEREGFVVLIEAASEAAAFDRYAEWSGFDPKELREDPIRVVPVNTPITDPSGVVEIASF